jgi:hypothetical protein
MPSDFRIHPLPETYKPRTLLVEFERILFLDCDGASVPSEAERVASTKMQEISRELMKCLREVPSSTTS